MAYDPQKHHRRSIRLKGYDYSQAGAYYFTIVAQYRLCLFGDVQNVEMQLNDAGEMLWTQWEALPERFPNVELDEFIVMPNHVHGILLITDRADKTRRGEPLWSPNSRAPNSHVPNSPPSDSPPRDSSSPDFPTAYPTLGNILGAWKSIVTGEYIKGVREQNWQRFEKKLFQRDYYERIIRNERELDAIRNYIINNPANWNDDENYPKNTL